MLCTQLRDGQSKAMVRLCSDKNTLYRLGWCGWWCWCCWHGIVGGEWVHEGSLAAVPSVSLTRSNHQEARQPGKVLPRVYWFGLDHLWDIYSHFWSTCTRTLYCITQSLNFEATLKLICPVQCCIHILVTTFCIWMDIQLSFEVWIIRKIWEYFRPVTDLSSQSRGQKTSLLLSKFRQKFCWD